MFDADTIHYFGLGTIATWVALGAIVIGLPIGIWIGSVW